MAADALRRGSARAGALPLALAGLILGATPVLGETPATPEEAARWMPRSIDLNRLERVPPSRLPCAATNDPHDLAACVGRSIERRPSARIWPKRASQTLKDGWGNDVDMAVLVAALLRLKGHPAENVSVQLAENAGHAAVYLATTREGGEGEYVLLDPYLSFIGPEVEAAWSLEGRSRGGGFGFLAGIVVVASGGSALVALGALGAGVGVGETYGGGVADSRIGHVMQAARYEIAFNDRDVSSGFESKWRELARRAIEVDAWTPEMSPQHVRNLGSMNEGIVFLGDSLTRYKGGESDYPTHLGRLLGVAGRNAGVEGDTTVDAWRRVAAVARQRPRIVVLCLGGNDFMKGLAPSTTDQHFVAVVQTLQASGAIVAVVAYQPLFPRAEWSSRYDALAQHGVYLLPDPWAEVQGDASLTLDLVHPNAHGARRAAERLAPAVRELIAAADAARERAAQRR